MRVNTRQVTRALLVLAPLALAGCVSFNSHPTPPPQSTTVVVPPTGTTSSTTTTVVCPGGAPAPC